ncbi:MAG: hypothetical protein A2075_11605 [Geobacteraceae bacterium GWC2_58_44]|nr:MAG: hypothetical protein A2075_11605 [Geobacteraceae bacterium GWC2_58_44]HBG04804.1 outer membrane receptor for ferric coprogen and ferric-rhodotorulic acid [Geobacter sp.]
MRNFVVLSLMFVSLLAGALDCAAADDASPGAVEAVMDLLLKKGLISREEAALIRQQAALPRKDAAAADAAAPASKPRTPARFSASEADMLRAKLNLIFVKQGVLGADEAEQIAERIGRKWSPGAEDDVIAAPDEEIEYHRTTLPKEGLLADIDQLVLQGLLTGDEAERIKLRLAKKLALERLTNDIDSSLREELDRQVTAKIVPVPEWATRIKIGGDFRLRYQADFFDGDGGGLDAGNGIFVKPDKPTELYNSSIDRHQLRIRARLAVTAKVNDEVDAGIGLATGNTTNPVSTNATLGDTLNKKNFLLDLAYLKWSPLADLTLWGGRFANPWFGSDLVWDPDVNFDGAAFSYRPQLSPTVGMFLTGGAFPIQEIELSGHDKWLFAGQLGLQYRNMEKITATVAAAFYDFENVTGAANAPSRPNEKDWTAPQFQQKGNTLFDIDPGTAIKTAYAAEYRELNFGGSLDLGYWDPLRVVLVADYVRNIGYDSAWVNSLTGHDVKRETEGYQFGIGVGYPETRAAGLWRVLLNYKHLEADAVIDAFTESDFHLGGTNAKGWIVGGELGVAKNTWLSTRWLTTNEISGPPLAIDVFQFNLNAKF